MAERNPLRRRMVEDMNIRNLSPVTQRCYVHAVAKFARHFNRPPDQLGLAEVRAYQIHLNSTGASWAGFNVVFRPCASSTASPLGARRWSSVSPTRGSSSNSP
jgi:hypothetical protein